MKNATYPVDSSCNIKIDVAQCYSPIQPDETLWTNWRVIHRESGRTMVAMAGGIGFLAAQIVAAYLNDNEKVNYDLQSPPRQA